MLKVVLIGTGNVARFLFDVLKAHPLVEVAQVVGRNENALAYFRETTSTSNNFVNLSQADVYILAISDEAIEAVSRQLEIKDGILVHTAGSVSIETLPEDLRRGVLYPLQTFSGNIPDNLNEIPICIEAFQEEDYAILDKLALCISDRVERINSEQRKHLHLAAVFANNFSNHLYHLTDEICKEHQVPFDLLRPLIKETCNKIMELTPYEAQTGPARRGDQKTVNEHLNLLSSRRLKTIYTTLSESIQKTYGKEL